MKRQEDTAPHALMKTPCHCEDQCMQHAIKCLYVWWLCCCHVPHKLQPEIRSSDPAPIEADCSLLPQAARWLAPKAFAPV